jgi:hypothetical protein
MVSSISNATQTNASTAVSPIAKTMSEATKAAQTTKNDQISVSNLAKRLASDGDTQAQESRESGSEKASEKVRNKA